MTKKLRHRAGYYKGCYRDLDEKDWGTDDYTLKEVLDMWWNSVRIKLDGGDIYCCYKTAYTCDPAYVDFSGNEVPKDLLKKRVSLSDCYDDDADGYPIIYGRFVEDK